MSPKKIEIVIELDYLAHTILTKVTNSPCTLLLIVDTIFIFYAVLFETAV
jgi:hypothetical protein